MENLIGSEAGYDMGYGMGWGMGGIGMVLMTALVVLVAVALVKYIRN